MKKIILGAVIVSAIAFTGCEVSSSDDDETVTSCNTNSNFWGIPRHLCIDSKDQSTITSYCQGEMAEIKDAEQEDIASAVIGTGCPSGAKKTCENMILNGTPVTIYAYDESTSKDACELLLNSFN